MAGSRKTVTVLFADVSGSTALGERLDPESLRRVLQRYFEMVRGIVGAHGGTVEKFIGDAAMAVFGIPVLHEDDALRAARTAVRIRSSLQALNEELEQEWGVRLEVRIGLQTGEVVADEAPAETLVTGDAVNVAARLQQQAAPGEILIGDRTHALIRQAAVAEHVGALGLRGKVEPVRAFRLDDVRPGAEAIARRVDTPLVARDREYVLLRQAFDRAVAGPACHVVSILGAAGVGKSRLVHEFVRTVRATATVVRGRCLPYGEGVTFRPVTEIVAQLAGVHEGELPAEIRRKVGALLESHHETMAVADRVSAALWRVGTPGSTEETFSAVRTLLEVTARRGPVVAVIDDLQWAEPTLLDLVEYLADWTGEVPLLLVCVARPELLDLRPGWGGGKKNAATAYLESLSDADAHALVANALGEAALPASVEKRVVDAAEGNPLFLEEVLAMLMDSGLVERSGERWVFRGDLNSIRVPASIEALLAARIDGLPAEARQIVQRAAIVGKAFAIAPVSALSSDHSPDSVRRIVLDLTRRELLRRDPPSGDRTDRYRFRHALIREAAYGGIPKQLRAELHERLADWLASADLSSAGVEETEGYHVEQAFRYRAELGPLDSTAKQLAARAARLLVRAAQDAEGVYAYAEARRHFERVGALLERVPQLAGHLDVTLDGVFGSAAESAYRAGDHDAAVSLAQRALAALGDEYDRVRAALLTERLGRYYWQTGDSDAARLAYERAVRLIPADPPSAAGARVLAASAQILMLNSKYEESQRQCEAAIRVARAAGAKAEESHALNTLGVATSYLGDTRTGLRHLRRALQIAIEANSQEDIDRAHGNLGEQLRWNGNHEEALAVHVEGAMASGRRGWDDMRHFQLAGATETALLIGRWSQADELSRAALYGGVSGLTAKNVQLVRAELEIARGDFDAATATLAELPRSGPRAFGGYYRPHLFACLAQIAMSEGRLDEARGHVWEGFSLLGDVRHPAVLELVTVGLRVLGDRAAVARADRDERTVDSIRQEAAEMAARVDPIVAPLRGAPSPSPEPLANAFLCEAELMRIEGRSDPQIWARVAAAWDAYDAPYRAAYARFREAEADLAAAQLTGARRAIEEARRVARKLGAKPLEAAIDELAGRLPVGSAANR
jgi:class 3 adenylate cyclase/tetratricopeptide (TPR) repeat protein